MSLLDHAIGGFPLQRDCPEDRHRVCFQIPMWGILRLRIMREAWHHSRCFGTESCRVMSLLNYARMGRLVSKPRLYGRG